MKNNFEIKGSIVEIQVKGRFGTNLTTKISLEDFERVSKVQTTWYANTDNKNQRIYVRGNVTDEEGYRKIVLLHRVIMNCPEGLVCNHKDGNTLNNTRENLEVVTTQENIIHGMKLNEVFVRKARSLIFKDWYEVIWIIDNEMEFPASLHFNKNEAQIYKYILEIRQRPSLLEYVDYEKKFLELGYDWSLVPFTFNCEGEFVPRLVTMQELRELKKKGEALYNGTVRI